MYQPIVQTMDEEQSTNEEPKKTGRKFPPQLIRRRRKSNHCLNCGAEFDIENNYCPHCGQENNHNRVSFGTLVVDFLNNYFSLDSKFSNSLLPFFLNPGRLTQKFIEGKRASFVNPVRLYLIISLVFFLIFGMVSQEIVQEGIDKFNTTKEILEDSTQVELREIISRELSESQQDSLLQLLESVQDSVVSPISIETSFSDSTDQFVSDDNLDTYLRLRKENLDANQILDSLQTGSLSAFQYDIVRKLIRLDKAESQIVLGHVLSNLPIMMIFIVPIFALILKLFYIRRGKYYITHVVHALHLHSFAYVIYGVAFLAGMYWTSDPDLRFNIGFFSILLVVLHSYFSFLKVYEQRWFKTLVKFSLISFIYSWLLFFAILTELFFSVLTY